MKRFLMKKKEIKRMIKFRKLTWNSEEADTNEKHQNQRSIKKMS